MQERLDLIRLSPQAILDAGCGKAADLMMLGQRFPQALVTGIDASPALLHEALMDQSAGRSAMQRTMRRWLSFGARDALSLLCGDFAALPVKAGSVDMVWSNLALHWHPQPDAVFAEWRRVLRRDGLLMFSCFGPDTFRELRTAFQDADDAAHVLPFVDMHDYGDMLVHAGFSTPVMDMETITVTYGSIDKLFSDVRAWGGNPLDTRRRGLMGRHAMQRLGAALERSRRADGTLPLTFEIVYGHAFRPPDRLTADGESIVHFVSPKR